MLDRNASRCPKYVIAYLTTKDGLANSLVSAIALLMAVLEACLSDTEILVARAYKLIIIHLV